MIERLLIVIVCMIAIIFIPYYIGKYFDSDKKERFIYYWITGILFFLVLTFIGGLLALTAEVFYKTVIYWIIHGKM